MPKEGEGWGVGAGRSVLASSFYLDCKTVGFFLKISKEISKAWRKSVTRVKRASLTRPTGVWGEIFLASLPSLAPCFSLIPDLLFDCSRVLEYVKIRTVLQSTFYLPLLSLSSCIIISDTCLSPNKTILSRTPQMIPNLRFTPINVEVSPLRNIYSALTVTCKVTEYKQVISGTEG